MKKPKFVLSLQLKSVTKLLDTYMQSQQYDKALPIGLKWAELNEEFVGPEEPYAAFGWSRIGDLHLDHNFNPEAEKCYKRALEIAEKKMGLDHENLVETYTSLGACLGLQNRHEEGLEYFYKARSIAEANNWPSDNQVVVAIQTSITACELKLGKMPEQLQLTPEEKVAENRDQKIMQAAALANQLMGSTEPLDIPGARKIESELEYWSMLGNTGKCKLALQNGENINQQFSNGETALHNAAAGNHIDLVKLLLAAGADREIKMQSGETALEVAQKEDHKEVVDLLVNP